MLDDYIQVLRDHGLPAVLTGLILLWIW